MNTQAPMEAWKVVVLTVLALLTLAVVAIPVYSSKIQQHLGEKADGLLQERDIGWATVEMDGRDAVLTGIAPSDALLQETEQAVLAIRGMRTVESRLELPASISPYAFSASYDAGRIAMEGYVPDEESRGHILALAEQLYGDGNVDAQVLVGEGAPEGWLDSLNIGIAQLRRLESGKLVVVDQKVTLDGAVENRALLDSVKSQLSVVREQKFELAFGVTSTEDVMETCQHDLSSLLAGRNINFRTGSADVLEESNPLLEALFKVAGRCGEFEIEIAGHTDSKGTFAQNASLSLQRAEAVVSWLAARGLDASRMTAVGYGERNPIASNNTESGRAKNRRIEFLVKGK